MRWTHVDAIWPFTNNTQRDLGGNNLQSRTQISVWWKPLESHGKQKPRELSKLGLEIFKENEIKIPHPLKEYLGVGCVTFPT
jgi:hypothetical protein